MIKPLLLRLERLCGTVFWGIHDGLTVLARIIWDRGL